MNAISIELTMQDLLQMALGVPKITDFNLSVLQSLLDLILKKLDCEHETVSMTGCESQQLKELLRQSRISPLPFKVEKMDTLPEKIKRLSALEDRMTAIIKKFDDHITEIRKCYEERSINDPSFELKHWQKHAVAVEDLCSIPDDVNKVACKLIANHHFNMKLMRLIAEPLKERLMESSAKIEEIHLQLLDFTRLARERYKTIILVEGCAVEIERLQQRILKEENIFNRTLEEIQEQLDMKLDKGSKTELKFYLNKLVMAMEKLQREILAKRAICPGKPTLPKSNTTECLSCGGAYKCAERPFHVGKQHNWDRMTIPTPRQYCGCLRACLDSVQQEALRQHLEEVAAFRDASLQQPYLTCPPLQVIGGILGDNGSYYMKG